ncbi:MAG: lipoyl(octanoyl) transferase LipB [Lentisphaerae bacterium]|nr:lipoyl(octanoyl) transferase LipB [Lentisphaerota bacterium]
MSTVLNVMDLGRQPYRPVLELQERLVAERVRGEIPDTLVLVEHEPVYTMGRRATEEHILATPEQLQRLGIDVVQTGRGGDVTYHGPGQLVGYPILHLGERGGGVVRYVSQLEQAILATLAGLGVTAGTDAINRGVWVGRHKIAAIGVRVTRLVSQHGFALNVNTNLAHYAGIVPCGLHDRGVTSLHLLRDAVTLEAVKAGFVKAFQREFGYDEVRQVTSAMPVDSEPETGHS